MLNSENLSAEIHTAIIERILLRAQVDRLEAIIRVMRADPRFIPMMRDDPQRGPSFDWRIVLCNPQIGWPADVVADAKIVRDAERRAAATAA